MSTTTRPTALWALVLFLVFSVALMLVGQTTAVFDYELAVRLGLQESTAQVSGFGAQVNRAFGTSDTLVYISLMVASVVGLLLRKRWSLLTTAAVAGISAYWSVTVAFILLNLPGQPGYSYVPGLEIWLFIATYAVFGVLALAYLVARGEALLE